MSKKGQKKREGGKREAAEPEVSTGVHWWMSPGGWLLAELLLQPHNGPLCLISSCQEADGSTSVQACPYILL